MALSIDPATLFGAFAHAIQQRLLPALNDEDARFVADAGSILAAYQSLQCRSAGDAGSIETARAMAVEIERLIARQAPPETLVKILDRDAASYRDAAAGLADELARIAAAPDMRPTAPAPQALAAFLRECRGDPHLAVRNIAGSVGGYSKQTVMFECVAGNGNVEPMAMRRDLHIANIGTTVMDEFAILRAVHATGFPVAEPLWVEAGTDALPGPFLISRRMPGRVTGDPLGVAGAIEFDPASVLAGLLAQLHSIDVDALDVDGYSAIRFDETLQRQRIAEWADKYRRHVAQPVAALEIGLAWLDANAHLAVGPRVLVHGEVGFHNILFDEGKLSALLDWELAHVGNAADDLAYVRRFVEPYGSFAAFLDAYAAAGGHVPPVHALSYFEVFGNVRNAILGVMGMHHFNAGGHHDLPLVRIILTTGAAYVETLTGLLGGIIAAHGFRWHIGEAQ